MLAVTDRKLCSVHLRVAALTIAGSLLVAAGRAAAPSSTLRSASRRSWSAFKNGTPTATRLKVRAGCSHIPQARPEALPTNHLASDNLYDVIYRVDNASDAQLARLESCLTKIPVGDRRSTCKPPGAADRPDPKSGPASVAACASP